MKRKKLEKTPDILPCKCEEGADNPYILMPNGFIFYTYEVVCPNCCLHGAPGRHIPEAVKFWNEDYGKKEWL